MFSADAGLGPRTDPWLLPPLLSVSQAQAKAKGSKSPSAGRKGPQLSPQPQKKGPPSPQGTRKSASGSKATPQASEVVATQLLGQSPIQEGASKAQGMR